MAIETLRRLMEPRVHARDLLDMQAYAAQSAFLLAFNVFAFQKFPTPSRVTVNTDTQTVKVIRMWAHYGD